MCLLLSFADAKKKGKKDKEKERLKKNYSKAVIKLNEDINNGQWPKAGASEKSGDYVRNDANKKILDDLQKYSIKASQAIGSKIQNKYMAVGMCVEEFKCESIHNASTSEIETDERLGKTKLKPIDILDMQKFVNAIIKTEKEDVNLTHVVRKDAAFGREFHYNGIAGRIVSQGVQHIHRDVIAGIFFDAWKLTALNTKAKAVRAQVTQSVLTPDILQTVCLFRIGSHRAQADNFCRHSDTRPEEEDDDLKNGEEIENEDRVEDKEDKKDKKGKDKDEKDDDDDDKKNDEDDDEDEDEEKKDKKKKKKDKKKDKKEKKGKKKDDDDEKKEKKKDKKDKKKDKKKNKDDEEADEKDSKDDDEKDDKKSKDDDEEKSGWSSVTDPESAMEWLKDTISGEGKEGKDDKPKDDDKDDKESEKRSIEEDGLDLRPRFLDHRSFGAMGSRPPRRRSLPTEDHHPLPFDDSRRPRFYNRRDKIAALKAELNLLRRRNAILRQKRAPPRYDAFGGPVGQAAGAVAASSGDGPGSNLASSEDYTGAGAGAGVDTGGDDGSMGVADGSIAKRWTQGFGLGYENEKRSEPKKLGRRQPEPEPEPWYGGFGLGYEDKAKRSE